MQLTETQRQLFLAISLRLSTAVISKKEKTEKRTEKNKSRIKPEKIAA